MPSLMLSALGKVLRDATPDAIRQTYPHPWLVWEPGMWTPPARDNVTQATLRIATPPPSSSEALALALVPRRPGTGQATLGRASTCDLEINDATLSQTHLLFMEAQPGVWTVRDAGSRNGSWLDGLPLRPGVPMVLRDGARILAARVCLTYLEAPGLMRRIGAGRFEAPRVRSTLS